MDARFMIHSPMLGICLPSQVPAGMEYRPQWMNMPKRASLHQAMRASRGAGVSVSWIAATGWAEETPICSPSTWANEGSAHQARSVAAAVMKRQADFKTYPHGK